MKVGNLPVVLQMGQPGREYSDNQRENSFTVKHLRPAISLSEKDMPAISERA